MGHQGAEKPMALCVLYRYGGEVFYVFIAQHLGVFFDIYPNKNVLRILASQMLKAVFVFFAGIAPLRAVADNDQAFKGLES